MLSTQKSVNSGLSKAEPGFQHGCRASEYMHRCSDQWATGKRNIERNARRQNHELSNDSKKEAQIMFEVL
jgi:hypothetical protein